jgi:hypothetical protein
MDLANEGAEFVDLERAGRKILRDVVLQQLLHGEQPLGICSFCFESCSMRSGCLWSRIAPTFAANSSMGTTVFRYRHAKM